MKDSVKRKRGAPTKGKSGKKSKVGVEKIDPEQPVYSTKDSKKYAAFLNTMANATKSSDEEMETTVPDDNDHVDDEEEYVSEIE